MVVSEIILGYAELKDGSKIESFTKTAFKNLIIKLKKFFSMIEKKKKKSSKKTNSILNKLPFLL